MDVFLNFCKGLNMEQARVILTIAILVLINTTEVEAEPIYVSCKWVMSGEALSL